MKQLPKARTTKIITQETDKELLIYDLEIDKAFCLNQTSAMVWQLCNGNNSVSEICQSLSQKLKVSVSEELVWLALVQLKRDRLLDKNTVIENSFGDLSRRQVIRKIGLASMVTLPLVTSLIAPIASNAQSACFSLFTNCTTNSQCCSGACRMTSGNGAILECCAGTTANVILYNPGQTLQCLFASCDFWASAECCSGMGIEVPSTCVPPGKACQCV